MKLFSIFVLLVLTSCEALEKNESSLKKTAHDAIDEMIDEAVEKDDGDHK